MRFLYMQVQPGVYRSYVPVTIWGPSPRHSGCKLDDRHSLRSAAGQLLVCKIAVVDLELRVLPFSVRWTAEVAVPTTPLAMPPWGMRGFLQYFRATFNGPARHVTLTPSPKLPQIPWLNRSIHSTGRTFSYLCLSFPLSRHCRKTAMLSTGCS